MIVKFIEQFKGYPQIELSPIERDGASGYILVTPLHFNLDTGRYELKSSVDANVSLGSMPPDVAEQWGELLRTASIIAQRQARPWFSENVIEENRKLWNRVDELLMKFERNTQ